MIEYHHLVIPARDLRPGDEIADENMSWSRLVRISPALALDSADDPPITVSPEKLCRVRRLIAPPPVADHYIDRLRRLEALVAQS